MSAAIEKMLFFLYDFLWTLAAVLLLPFALVRKNTTFADRLLWRLPSCRIRPGSVWVHALSVGEVISALPLVKAIKEKYPRKDVIFTASTSQGLDTARSELRESADCVLRMPLDFWWNMRRMIRFVSPAILIVVETDLWPGYLRFLRRRGVRILLVNSRISPKTFSAYRRFRFLAVRMLFGSIERCLMQSDLDCRRLLEIGVPPEKVVRAGNIKFDREWAPMKEVERVRLAGSLGLTPDAEIWVAGSIHKGEEEAVLNAYFRLRPLFPKLRLIIAPRRIEESRGMQGAALSMSLKAVLRTDQTASTEEFSVLILNTIGELSRIYGLARITFVGGSLVPAGGHNLLEPASLGRPVLFGPHMHNFVAMSELLLEAGGGVQVADADSLFEAVKDLLLAPHRADAMGRRAKDFVEKNRGALDRIMDHVQTRL